MSAMAAIVVRLMRLQVERAEWRNAFFRFAPEKEVPGNAHEGHQRQILVDGGDAQIERLLW